MIFNDIVHKAHNSVVAYTDDQLVLISGKFRRELEVDGCRIPRFVKLEIRFKRPSLLKLGFFVWWLESNGLLSSAAILLHYVAEVTENLYIVSHINERCYDH